jgi:hypothetical protein
MKASAGRTQLDAMIVEIELTLVSIIQGVALTVLIESSRDAITDLKLIYWPYVLAGLLVILIFWSRAVLHIITLIRWPLEFGHNFLYIGCALIEAISFAQLSNPANWFGFGAAFMASGWLLFFYDLRLIHARQRDSRGEAGNRLYERVRQDQWLNLALLLPGVFALNVICAICIRTWPGIFVRNNAHLWLIGFQLLGFAGYLIYVVRFYLNLAPLIADAHREWQDSSINLDQV